MQNEIIRKTLEDYFQKDEELSKKIFNVLTFIIYKIKSQESDSDLYILAKKLPEDLLVDLISYFDGDVIKMPSKEEYKKCKLLAFTFYMKEIQGKNWDQIKGVLNFPENFDSINSISLGRQLSFIKENLASDILSVMKEYPNKDFEKVVSEYMGEE